LKIFDGITSLRQGIGLARRIDTDFLLLLFVGADFAGFRLLADDESLADQCTEGVFVDDAGDEGLITTGFFNHWIPHSGIFASRRVH
jgi:hypothetical protein